MRLLSLPRPVLLLAQLFLWVPQFQALRAGLSTEWLLTRLSQEQVQWLLGNFEIGERALFSLARILGSAPHYVQQIYSEIVEPPERLAKLVQFIQEYQLHSSIFNAAKLLCNPPLLKHMLQRRIRPTALMVTRDFAPRLLAMADRPLADWMISEWVITESHQIFSLDWVDPLHLAWRDGHHSPPPGSLLKLWHIVTPQQLVRLFTLCASGSGQTLLDLLIVFATRGDVFPTQVVFLLALKLIHTEYFEPLQGALLSKMYSHLEPSHRKILSKYRQSLQSIDPVLTQSLQHFSPILAELSFLAQRWKEHFYLLRTILASVCETSQAIVHKAPALASCLLWQIGRLAESTPEEAWIPAKLISLLGATIRAPEMELLALRLPLITRILGRHPDPPLRLLTPQQRLLQWKRSTPWILPGAFQRFYAQSLPESLDRMTLRSLDFVLHYIVIRHGERFPSNLQLVRTGRQAPWEAPLLSVLQRYREVILFGPANHLLDCQPVGGQRAVCKFREPVEESLVANFFLLLPHFALHHLTVPASLLPPKDAHPNCHLWASPSAPQDLFGQAASLHSTRQILRDAFCGAVGPLIDRIGWPGLHSQLVE